MYVMPLLCQDSGASSLSAEDLGPSVTLMVAVKNDGPSDVPEATLTIYIPTNGTATGDLYYIYPVKYEVSEDAGR